MTLTAKALAALWDEVQGECDHLRLEQVVSGADRPLAIMLDGWSPLHFVCENRSLANATRAQAIAVLVRAGVDCTSVDEVLRSASFTLELLRFPQKPAHEVVEHD